MLLDNSPDDVELPPQPKDPKPGTRPPPPAKPAPSRVEPSSSSSESPRQEEEDISPGLLGPAPPPEQDFVIPPRPSTNDFVAPDDFIPSPDEASPDEPFVPLDEPPKEQFVALDPPQACVTLDETSPMDAFVATLKNIYTTSSPPTEQEAPNPPTEPKPPDDDANSFVLTSKEEEKQEDKAEDPTPSPASLDAHTLVSEAYSSMHMFYLRAKCKVWDYLGSKLTNPHSFEPPDGETPADIWILGQKYSIDAESLEDAESKELWLKNIADDLKSRIWFMYRKNFPPLRDFRGPSDFTSDAGWGCMIRTTQMLYANALLWHTLGRKWRLNKDKRQCPHYVQTLKYFVDLPAERCVLSIHHMMEHGVCFKKPAGVWYSPSEACLMASRCLNASGLLSIVSHLSSDGIVYLDDITKQCQTKAGWRSLILILPLRLGLDKFNMKYGPALLECLRLPWSLGFVGGRPKRSLYFVGSQDQKLLYLDPHQVRPALTLENDFAVVSPDFHCDEVNGLELEEIDPSLAVGFYFKSKADFMSFWECASVFKKRDYPIFTCEPEKPSYPSFDMDDDDVDVEEEEDDEPDPVDDKNPEESAEPDTPLQTRKSKSAPPSARKRQGSSGGGWLLL